MALFLDLPTRATASAITLLSAIALSTPSMASAASCVGAPGASALEQYCEAVQDVQGDKQKPQSESGENSGGSGVSTKTSQALNQAGVDGQAVARLAGDAKKSAASESKAKPTRSKPSATSPKPGGGTPAGGAKPAVAAPTSPSNNPLNATRQAVESGPTAGPGVVWSLVGLSALGGVGAVLLRRRRTDLQPPEDLS